MRRSGLFIAALLLVTCDFPYQPTLFELPAIPSPFTSADSIRSFTGSSNVKIAYTMNTGSRSVWFIDFSQPSPLPVPLEKPRGKENIHADSPLLSPDGSFVAYFLTQGANIQGAYIQRLDPLAEPVLISANGTEPHWWTDSTGQIYIIYSNQFISSTLAPGRFFTFRQKVTLAGAGSLAGQADTIAPYPMNGGLSADGRFLCTGYTDGAFFDIASSKLIRINENVQICNPSISPDTLAPYRMMFLNFYGKQNFSANPFAGSADYPADNNGVLPMHGVLYIVDGDNAVRDYIPSSLAGRSYNQWQDPEWSNRPDVVIALAVLDEGAADAFIIRNVGDGNRTKGAMLVTPGKFKLNDTSTPCLWIGN